MRCWRKKKWMLGLIAASMLLSILTGCKKPEQMSGNTTPSQSMSTEPTGSTPPATSTPASSAPTEPAAKELRVTYNLIPGKPYKFGMLQEVNFNTVYYLDGTSKSHT